MKFAVGDRVYVTDPALAQLREMYQRFEGKPAPPNHHGTVAEVWDGSCLINFDEGSAAPYPFAEIRHLEEGSPDA